MLAFLEVVLRLQKVGTLTPPALQVPAIRERWYCVSGRIESITYQRRTERQPRSALEVRRSFRKKKVLEIPGFEPGTTRFGPHRFTNLSLGWLAGWLAE